MPPRLCLTLVLILSLSWGQAAATGDPRAPRVAAALDRGAIQPGPVWSETVGQPPVAGPVQNLAPDLRVRELVPGVWLIVSEAELPGFGRVSSNALLATGPVGSVLVDAPATPAQTEQVLAWAEQRLGRPVRAAVGSHAHVDRIGGFAALHRHGIATWALAATRRLAQRAGLPRPPRTLAAQARLRLAGVLLETLYPGPGHTPDNLVIGLPEAGVLFAGCLVKEAASTGPGNLAQADVAAWPDSLARVQQHFAGAWRVVPGHGAVGGMELLEHTRDLVVRR